MMQKRNILQFLILSVFLLIAAPAFCGEPAGEGKDPWLLRFSNGTTVLRSEFEYVYQKNNGGWDAAKGHTPEQYKEYLDLYINFKRKVMEAEKLGLDQTKTFQDEFEGYRKQLAQPYLVERKVQDQLIQEAYDRSKERISASHILINCGPDASAKDTLEAYQRALSLRDSIMKGGKTFEDMAVKYSQDPSAVRNKGYLGYFSAFDMVYPFETGAYNTGKGQVSMPIRTGYGYHLIKVLDRQPFEGKATAAHIIVRVGAQYSAKDDAQAQKIINEIYAQLKSGADWGEMAANYSDDPTTAKKGGDLGNGRLISEMELLKIKLKEGQFSEPFKTEFGWHILKVTQVEPIKSFDDSKAELKSRISRDARSYLSKEKLVERVRKEYGFKVNTANLEKFNASIPKDKEAEYTKGFWKPEGPEFDAILSMELYTMANGNDKEVGTIRDYTDWYTKNRKGYQGATIEQATMKNMQLFEESVLLAFEEKQLPKKYPEYRELLKEYRDGILLFTLTEDKVWRKAIADTTGLKEFYENHKDNFKAGERVVAIEYISESADIISQVIKMLDEGKTRDEIDAKINANSALNLRIREQTFEKGKADREAELFDKQAGYHTQKMDYGKASRALVVKENLPAGVKSFDQAKSEAITQYQNHLEKEWLAALEKEYPVKVNEKELKKLFK